MVKISISLPNNTHITFESEEAEILHEIVGMVLRDLPRDLMQAPSAGDVQPAGAPVEKSTSVAGSALAAAVTTAPEPAPPVQSPPPAPPSEPPATPAPEAAPPVQSPPPAPPAQTGEPPATPATAPAAAPQPSRSAGDDGGEAAAEMPAEFLSENGRANFTAFCQAANPLGDMRRVVVAAEGARRHFGVDGVNADDLGWLFDIAGWRRPGNFTQTLRNAARSKFGWLERIPGRSGRYAATPLGLSKTQTG